MATENERKRERDQRLDQLVLLTRQWSAAAQAEYAARAKMLQSLLRGRGVGAVAQATATAASQLVVEEIGEFLTGARTRT